MDDLCKNFVKKFKMPISSKFGDSTYLIPISIIAHLLCVFKNYSGCANEFFCVLPKRKWSGYFSYQIGVSHQSISTENLRIECSNSSSTNVTTDDVSIHFSENGSTDSIDDLNSLDFGDSSDDSSDKE